MADRLEVAQRSARGFLRDLAQVWQEHGHDTMVHTADDSAGHVLCSLQPG